MSPLVVTQAWSSLRDPQGGDLRWNSQTPSFETRGPGLENHGGQRGSSSLGPLPLGNPLGLTGGVGAGRGGGGGALLASLVAAFVVSGLFLFCFVFAF